MIIFRKFRDNIGREQVKHHEEDIKAYLNMSPEEKEEFKKEIENRNNKKKELNKLGRETDKDIREAVKGSKVESKVGKILDKSEKEMKKAAQKEYSMDISKIDEKLKEIRNPRIRFEHTIKPKENPIKRKIDELRRAGEKNRVRLGYRKFSKQDREVVPADIVQRVKDGGGVIQKDHNGDWRIISMKTKTNKSGKPEYWDAKYDSKESASKALGGYFANK